MKNFFDKQFLLLANCTEVIHAMTLHFVFYELLVICCTFAV